MLRSGPPFDLGSIFRTDSDPRIERLRRQLVASLLAIPIAIGFSVWTTVNAPMQVPSWVVAAGGIAVACAWAVVIMRRPSSRWVLVAAWLGVAAGIGVAVVVLALTV